ncbi:hypothetical protein [Nonomuraea sp. NPDC050310]
MRRLITILLTAGTLAAGLATVTALPSSADSVRITGGGTENREW